LPRPSITTIEAIIAGAIASSTALVGFGLESVVEVSSALAVAWQFSASDLDRRGEDTLRTIAVSFAVNDSRWPT